MDINPMGSGNPVLDEIMAAHANLSPAAQSAVGRAGAMAGQAAQATPTPGIAKPINGAPLPVVHDASMDNSMMSGAQPAKPLKLATQEAPMRERGTLDGDQDYRTHLMNNPAPVSGIQDKIAGSSFGQNHPLLGKILGGAAQIGGSLAESLIPPGISQRLPFTQIGHGSQLVNADKAVTQDTTDQEKQAQTAGLQSEVPLRRAQTEHEQAETNSLQNPEPKPKEEEWSVSPEYTGPNGEPVEVEKNSGQMRVSGGDTAFKRIPKVGEGKEQNPAQQTYDSLLKEGMTPQQAYDKIREKPGGTVINQGTWTLDEDPTTGKPVLFNSKTGETREAPAGVAKAGTFAKNKAATAGVDQALSYAQDYGSRTAHTGPGDEALMEKFFELAKPSTGFRMSQPQIDMLKNAQSWMSGLEAHLRHATTGTWFSDDQRNQIISTMADLGKAKGIGGQSEVSTGSGKQVSLADAMALPQNKGKSEADVRKDIEAHGHTVVK